MTDPKKTGHGPPKVAPPRPNPAKKVMAPAKGPAKKHKGRKHGPPPEERDKRHQAKGRLPDGAQIAATYFDDRQLWVVRLFIPHPTGDHAKGQLFHHGGTGLFKALAELDDKFRQWLKEQGGSQCPPPSSPTTPPGSPPSSSGADSATSGGPGPRTPN